MNGLNDPAKHEWMALDLTRDERHDEIIRLVIRSGYTEPARVEVYDLEVSKFKYKTIGQRVWKIDEPSTEVRFQQPVPGARKLAVRHSDIELECMLTGTLEGEEQHIKRGAKHATFTRDKLAEFESIFVLVVGVILTAPMKALNALQHFEAVANTALANAKKDALPHKLLGHKLLFTDKPPSPPVLTAFTHNGAKVVLLEAPDSPLRPLNFTPANDIAAHLEGAQA